MTITSILKFYIYVFTGLYFSFLKCKVNLCDLEHDSYTVLSRHSSVFLSVLEMWSVRVKFKGGMLKDMSGWIGTSTLDKYEWDKMLGDDYDVTVINDKCGSANCTVD